MTRTWRASSPRREAEGAGRARPSKHRAGFLLLLATLTFLLVTTAALALTGDLTQPVGTAGCVSETGAGPCANGHALKGPSGVAVSPDGESVYVASVESSAVALLSRNTTTGALTQPAGTAGCVSETGTGPCADGHGLQGAFAVAVSPDGKSVYVSGWDPNSSNSGFVARFARNTTTGALTQLPGTAGCVSETGADACADGHGLKLPAGVAVSPDGKSVYTAGRSAVARFVRNTTTGAIFQPAGTAGCVSETGAGTCADGHALQSAFGVAVSPDGKSIYVAAPGSNAVARLIRNTTTGAIAQPAGTAGCISETGSSGTCADGHALSPLGVAVSPDGKSVYAASSDKSAVARVVRNTTTGAIFQPAGTAGCISETGSSGTCANGHGLQITTGVAVSPDGKSVYTAGTSSSASDGFVARLDRGTTAGGITQPADTTGCVSETGADMCADGHGLVNASRVAVSPDGNSVYVTSLQNGLGAVARFIRTP